MVLDEKNLSAVQKCASLLKKCRKLFFITGAGISADSGLPTYRGVGGLYNSGETEDAMSIEEALSGEVLLERPEITWKHLLRIEKSCRSAKFNRAHEVIAALEKRFEKVTVLTQNIDGFHSAAGSRRVIDIHGDIHNIFCTGCGCRKTLQDYSCLERIPPLCRHCGSVMRPDVVFFGESLDLDKVAALQQEMSQGFDILFSVGTTSVFPYISEPVYRAKALGKPVVEINPGETAVSALADIRIRLRAAEAFEEMWKIMKI